ncbi:MAG TPA: CHRD domain-containing protein [Promineifilum sp.]|nr:CHRD domain-containing protein [Promineifilum sp.]
MRRRIPTVLIVLLALMLTLAIAVAAFAAPGDSLRRTTSLWGANEVPGPGDPDGSGEATIKINMSRHQLCYNLVVRRIAPATAAHIHVGDPTVAGPVVVPLGAPTDGHSSGCIQNVDPMLLRAILRSPRDYYVNVHNADYPSGALRGQLHHPGS